MLKKHHSKTNHHAVRSNPVAIAIAKARMRRQMVTFGIEMFMTDDGEPALDLLAHLGWMLALGAEIAAQVMPGTTKAKRLHAALRTVLQMCADGGCWQASQAGVLQAATNEALALMQQHPDTGASLMGDADHIAARIRAGVANLSDVAGSEIYAAAAATEQTA
jgi:hypothetical protein